MCFFSPLIHASVDDQAPPHASPHALINYLCISYRAVDSLNQPTHLKDVGPSQLPGVAAVKELLFGALRNMSRTSCEIEGRRSKKKIAKLSPHFCLSLATFSPALALGD